MTHPKRALIIGIAGQDGSYLAQLLAAKKYEVHGVVRQQPGVRGAAQFWRLRLAGVADEVTLHWGDLLDVESITRIIESCRPDEIYNLAAAAFVPDSFEQPSLVRHTNAVAVRGLLDFVADELPAARFFQASTSEMFGDAPAPQGEATPFRPVSPYGKAKLEAHEAVVEFRDERGVFCCSGISFNHESPRRDLKYVTHKVTDAAARIVLGLEQSLSLGDLSARRDWGFAPEYVEGMWRMLDADRPEDFVLATGVSHSVGEMATLAFAAAGLRLDDHLLPADRDLLRPADPALLVGDAAKAKRVLGWEAETGLKELMEIMVEDDLKRLRGGGRSGLAAAR